MKPKTHDVVIIGGGVIGAACAYELGKHGVKAAILEKRHVGSGASGSSAAMLEFQTDAWRGDRFLNLAKISIKLFSPLHEEIKELVKIDFGFENCGILQLALSEEEAVKLENETIRLNYWGLKSQWLPQRDIADSYPQIPANNFGGVLFEEDGQVVGERFTTGLARAAVLKGADIFEGIAIEKIETRGNRITGIKTNKGTFTADTFVLAAGAWSDEVLKPLGIRLGIEPIRGQLLVYDTPRRPIDHPVYTKSGGYVTPKKDGYTLVGATVEKAGFDENPTDEAKRRLTSICKKILPELSRSKVRGMIAGLRPGSPDEMPILGPLAQFTNFIMATGHYRSGILLAPVTAQIISSLIQNRPAPLNLAPYFPSRFNTTPR